MGWRDWTGVGERRWKTAPNEQVQPSKTVWDLAQLLIVPAILVAVTFAWSAAQTTSDNHRADQARQDATLNGYFAQMGDLVLDRKLLTSKAGDAVRSVARTATLTTLRRLNGERQGEVVRFLREAGLIYTPFPRVELADADLRRANLTGADLTGATFPHAILRGAFLSEVYFAGADLTGADLTGAKFTRVISDTRRAPEANPRPLFK